MKKSIRGMAGIAALLAVGLTSCDLFSEPEPKKVKTSINEVTNGDFETGDLTGWTVVSDDPAAPVFEDKGIKTDVTYWNEGLSFNKEGTYHFGTWDTTGGEGKTGSLTSSKFVLAGTGWVSFRLGGGSPAGTAPAETGKYPNVVQVWVKGKGAAGADLQVAEYGNICFNDASFPNEDVGSWANMHRFIADLSKYKGQTLYFKVVKASTTAWGVMFLDSFQAKHDTVPVADFGQAGKTGGRDYTILAINQLGDGSLPDLP